MEGIIGELRSVAFTRAPRNWALCQGQTLSIKENQSLFTLIGTTYGGDGRATFALPDLRSRVVVGAGQGTGLFPYQLGESGGEETINLSTDQIPSHTHSATFTQQSGSSTIPAVAAAGNTDDPSANVLAQSPASTNMYSTEAANSNLKEAPVLAGGTIDLSLTGGSQPHDNRQPSLALNWIICLDGIFPQIY